MRRALFLVALVATPIGSSRATAQDVELLGRRYGTPVPDGYLRTKATRPSSFSFERGWKRRAPNVPSGGGAALDPRLGPLLLGPRSGPVVGTFEIPVLLGKYANSGSQPPFSRDTIAEAYFGAGPGTITDYYDEVSRSNVTLLGVVQEWLDAPGADTVYTGGQSGLTGGAGVFIKDLLAQLSIDWGPYDNDGPDGVPNSGDDDGFVDVLAVVHPTRGAECGGGGASDRIWSHRWTLSGATGSVFVTNTPVTGGGGETIRVDDYTVQPAIACSGGALSPIGVFAHELGHAFGLPDLYDTDGGHSGAGVWDLMATGSWGCNNASPHSPCHMGAWSKAALGWVDVQTLAPDLDHGNLTLPPVSESGVVFRVDAQDGSGEYFLLENRQRLGYDQVLFDEGLLIWHISPDVINARWAANSVNADDHMGVWLRQADGEGDLQSGSGRGDAGDPFPGIDDVRAFHAVSTPSSRTWDGAVSGLTVYDVAKSGEDVALGIATKSTQVVLAAVGVTDTSGIFTVDGQPVDPPGLAFTTSPFVQHVVEVAPGEPLAVGERRPFVGWVDTGSSERSRTLVAPVGDTTIQAEFAGLEYELALSVTGAPVGVSPATFTSTPPSADLWFPAGVGVTLLATPVTGFSFLSWTGALAGQSNPASFAMGTPLVASADFELVYTVVDTVIALPAATELDLTFEVANGTAPISWSLIEGPVPEGLSITSQGRLSGAALDLGSYPLAVRAVDANGLTATGVITLEMLTPGIPLEQAAQPFLLSGTPLSAAEINFLNRQGNGIAQYDIGDFRAWVLSSPDVPLSAEVTGPSPQRVVLRVAGWEGERR